MRPMTAGTSLSGVALGSSGGLLPFTVKSGGCYHFTVRSGHQHRARCWRNTRACGGDWAPVLGAACARGGRVLVLSAGWVVVLGAVSWRAGHPAPSTSTRKQKKRATCLRHVTSNLSPRHPAPATCLHHAHSQLTAPAPATCLESAREQLIII